MAFQCCHALLNCSCFNEHYRCICCFSSLDRKRAMLGVGVLYCWNCYLAHSAPTVSGCTSGGRWTVCVWAVWQQIYRCQESTSSRQSETPLHFSSSLSRMPERILWQNATGGSPSKHTRISGVSASVSSLFSYIYSQGQFDCSYQILPSKCRLLILASEAKKVKRLMSFFFFVALFKILIDC